jgi:prophage regulatory protein
MSDQPDRILRLDAVLARTGLSRSTLYRKVQNGSFPAQVQISARCVGWRESALKAWARNPMFYSARPSPKPAHLSKTAPYSKNADRQ